MARNLIPALLLVLIGRICMAQTDLRFDLKPNTPSVVKIEYVNNIRPRPIFAYTGSVLPYDSHQRQEGDSIPPGNGTKYLNFMVASPQKAILNIGRSGSDLLLLPNDTLTIQLDLSGERVWDGYHLVGKSADITEYYLSRSRTLKRIPERVRATIINAAATLRVMSRHLDSLLTVEEAYLKEYCTRQPLPAWFIKQEQLQIRYNDAMCRANGLNYRRFMKMDSVNVVPDDYFRFVTPALLNNASAAGLTDYQSFLKHYFHYLHSKNHAKENPAAILPALANKYLTGLAWEVFMIRQIEELLKGYPSAGEALLAKCYPKFTHKSWIDGLQDKYKKAYTLKSGDLAPNFALEDQLDSLTYLKGFRGNVLYLSFWFTGCGPCRKELPLENELVRYFEGKPVKIINICVHSSRTDWAKVSRLYNLKTVNLFANPSWARTLVAKYEIKSYPHYVLIDKEGKIVKNNSIRPSQNAKAEIEALLQD